MGDVGVTRSLRNDFSELAVITRALAMAIADWAHGLNEMWRVASSGEVPESEQRAIFENSRNASGYVELGGCPGSGHVQGMSRDMCKGLEPRVWLDVEASSDHLVSHC